MMSIAAIPISIHMRLMSQGGGEGEVDSSSCIRRAELRETRVGVYCFGEVLTEEYGLTDRADFSDFVATVCVSAR